MGDLCVGYGRKESGGETWVQLEIEKWGSCVGAIFP